MNTAVGPFEVCRHHCLDFWVAFVVPICAPIPRLVVVGRGVPSAVAPSLRTCSLIGALSPILRSPVLVSPILVVPSTHMTRWLSVVAPPRIARALVACIGLPLFLSERFPLAQPFLKEIPSFDQDAVAYVSDNIHQEPLGENDASSIGEV